MVNEKPFFSIIMPVYNSEKYLADAVKSILGQTFTDFELILVDDCSPDNSPAICDEFAAKDKRIRVIHSKTNNGPGNSRNIGCDSACGEYIMYFDSDDTLRLNTLELLRNACIGTDITVFGINVNHENKAGKIKSTLTLSCDSYFANTKEKVGEAFIRLSRAKIFQYACNKVYRHSFIKNSGVHYESMRLTEDFFYNIQLFEKAATVKIISDALYNYRKPFTQTLSNSYSPIFFPLSKRKYCMEKDFLANMNIESTENLNLVYFNHVKHIISAFVRNESKKSPLTSKQKKEFIENTLNDETVIHIFEHYNPCSILQKLPFGVLKTKNSLLCRLLAKAVSVMQKTAR